jgi:hypothetical protein
MPAGRKNEKREAGGEEREAGTSAAANVPALLRGNTQQSRAHEGAGPPAHAGGSVSYVRVRCGRDGETQVSVQRAVPHVPP